ncbi:TetR/AcrR family transcriptional regulator [Cupriavidus necator]|uniref:TetR/AcrR family transcriptional regulator n=1 Tax=Cupriavidus necator TaxID=106590 RepID=UPI0039C02A46
MSALRAGRQAEEPGTDVRQKVLDAASDLFYTQGVRAVGVDLVIQKAGVAKTSLYRHFGTKDDLVAAYLEREDKAFWETWNEVAAKHADDPRAELDAHLEWIGLRVNDRCYRGCAQINAAAEFPDLDHPARKVAAAHKSEMRRRLKAIATRLNVADPDRVAGQLTVLINGAFVSMQVLEPDEAVMLLQSAANAVLAANQAS